MKTTKLIQRIQKLLNRSPEETKLKNLRKTIKQLRNKQRDLEKKLKHSHGKYQRRRLQQKIDLLYLQRGKGLEVYRRIKAERQ